MILNAGNDNIHGKKFKENGTIHVGNFNANNSLLNGFRWEVNDDKTHSKYKVTDGKKGEFICNEKIF
jgi:hypothetical protein